MTLVPSYYKKFHCIADKCTHNCCIGWEIDIDSDTLSKYEKLDFETNSNILEHVEYDGDTCHFKLACDERCSLLRDDNLCRLICEFGEDALCDICSEHPRYRNYFGNREEIGLGLSCEEAARIILSYPEKVKFEPYGDSDVDKDESECDLISDRSEVLSIIQDRKLSISERITKVSEYLDASLPYSELSSWCDFFLSLERLDDKWTEILLRIKSYGIQNVDDVPIYKNELAAEQLLVCFICRHYKASDDGSNITDVFRLSYLSTAMIFSAAEVMCDDFENRFDALCEAARMYSSEVEYSTDNTDEVLFELSF